MQNFVFFFFPPFFFSTGVTCQTMQFLLTFEIDPVARSLMCQRKILNFLQTPRYNIYIQERIRRVLVYVINYYNNYYISGSITQVAFMHFSQFILYICNVLGYFVLLTWADLGGGGGGGVKGCTTLFSWMLLKCFKIIIF